jgi:hypothetical protein
MVPIIASAWWAPVLQTAIGALIGATGAIAGGAFGSWFTWQKERQSVAAAFAGEVQGFIDPASLASNARIREHPIINRLLRPETGT